MHLAHPALTHEQQCVLAEMDSHLLSGHSIQNVENAAERFVPRLFPGWSGALLLVDDFYRLRTRDGAADGRNGFTAADCWALHHGKVRMTRTPQGDLLCSHLRSAPAGRHFCVPLLAGEESQGILHVFAPEDCAECASSGDDGPDSKEVLAALGSKLSAALARFQTAAALSVKSPRDELTGLFSRSYVEESIAREIARAEVRGRAVSLVISSLDHLGRFRDECGDPAAQILLQAVAQMIQSKTRPQDLACRYQHGEFALVMPEVPANVASERAEQFRANIRTFGWCHNNTLSAPVTLSAGVASFPDHATDVSSLLRAAQRALARAEECGRDRVVVAAVARWVPEAPAIGGTLLSPSRLAGVAAHQTTS